MITLKLPIKLAAIDADLIHELQLAQSPMIRSAYSQAKLGLSEIEVRGVLRDRFSTSILDSWFIQSAVKSGIGSWKADKELKVDNRIFGGAKNLVRRAKGLITKEEWKELRCLPLYIIGESPQKGNRKFTFESADKIIFKPFKGRKIEITLPNMKKNWLKLWTSAVLLAHENKLPITVSLTSDYICLSFDDILVKKTIKFTPYPIKDRYAGIDLNPNYIGVSVFDERTLIETKLFSLKALTGKNTNQDKLSHETHEIGVYIGRWLKHLKVDKVFIEQLSFKSGSIGLGKSLNRLCKNQWKRSKFESSLKKFYPKLYEINAAYTSTIGNILNPALPDPIAASTAIANRGYELVIKKSKQFYCELPTQKYLEDLWKETEIPVFNSWKELHDFIKNAGLKYRVPIPEKEGFRNFSSRHSFVGVL